MYVSNVCVKCMWNIGKMGSFIYLIGEFRVKLWSALLPPPIISSEKKMLIVNVHF